MKQIQSKWTAWLALGLAMLLAFTSCAGGSDGNGAKSEKSQSAENLQQVAMGRYTERNLTLPETLNTIAGMGQIADRHFRIIGNETSGESWAGPWVIWDSTDGGESWKEIDAPWLDPLLFSNIAHVEFVDEDSLYILYNYYTAEELERLHEILAEDFESIEEEYDTLQKASKRFAFVKNGEIIQQDYTLPDNEYGSPAESFALGETGVISLAYTDFTWLDLASGTPAATIEIWKGWPLERGNYALTGDTLIHADLQNIEFYNTQTGELEKEVPMGATLSSSQPQQSVVDVPKATGEIYYADATGIYHVVADTTLVERLVDGSLTSLAIPTNRVKRVFAQEGNAFTLLLEGAQGNFLTYYEYDETVPTEPSQRLLVYSLQEEPTIRQAIGMYQLSNPEVKVEYEIGITEDDAITAADALRNLSTEILAGKGPDVLVLDQMPLDSYQEKGVLADLSHLLGERLAEDEYYPFVLNAYNKPEGLFAIPARFQFFAIYGEGLESIVDTASFVQYLKDNPAAVPNLHKEDLHHLYSFVSTDLLDDKQHLDTEKLDRHLAELEELSQLLPEYDERDYRGGQSALASGVAYHNNLADYSLAWMEDFTDFQYIYSSIEDKDKELIRAMPRANGTLFFPRVLLGINSQTERQELAEDFLAFVLSEEILSVSLNDGFAAHKGAVLRSAESPYPALQDGVYYSSGYRDPETDEVSVIEFHVVWPEEDEIAGAINLLDTLDTPVFGNQVIDDIVSQELANWLEEQTQSKEETKQAIQSKLDIYLTE